MSSHTASSLVVVITGLVPVIHGFFGFGPGGDEGVDGRIKFGHDDRLP